MAHRLRPSALLAGMLMVVGLLVAACGSGGNTQPTATTAPAASNLIISADIVEGSKNVPKDQATMRSCVLTSRFPRNGEMVFRARVYDPHTGDLMDDSAVSTLQVQLANGQTIDMKYGAHPKNPPNEFYWTGSWVVPKDNPTGTLNYSIVATAKDGRTGEFKPMIVQSSLPTILDETLPDAPPTS